MNAFSRAALKTVAGGGVIATALIAFAGVPAQATTLCDGVTPTVATELALRAAIAGLDPIICISAGTIDFSDGADATDGPIAIARNLTLIGVGEVVFDADNDTNFLITESGGPSLDVTVQNITMQHGFAAQPSEPDNVHTGSAIDFGTPGTLTVLNSTFTSNDGYGSAIWALDTTLLNASLDQPNVIVDNSTFTSNGVILTPEAGSAIGGYGDVTVTNSTFVGNHGFVGGAIFATASLNVQNNLFESNSATGWGGAITSDRLLGDAFVDSHPVTISNNTFVGNTADYNGGAVYVGRDASLANNTFVDNEALESGDAIHKDSPATVGLFANIFATSRDLPTVGQLGGPDLGGEDISFDDFGANISTFTGDASQLPISDLVTGQVGATYASISLSALADNGGPTKTMALSSDSIAVNAATPALRLAAAAIAQPTLDQRGITRGSFADSGAFEIAAPTELPNTGANATPALAIASGALLGGAALIGATALIARRRRQTS